MEKDSKQKSLTKAELHLMNILWDKGQASVGQLHDELENEKTPYTTTLSVMQVLTKKGIVTFEKVGKANIYKPILTREEYIQSFVTEARDNVFGGSMRSLFSFFVRNEKLSKEEIREILKEMGDE
jgi:predicted transcriptional regulator